MFPGKIAETLPDHPAIVMAGTGESLTYKQLDDGANRVSQLMTSHGLKPGDHVAMCLENHPRFFELVWGCHYAGLVYTCCSSRLTTDELAYIINDCGAKVFITSKYKADQAEQIVAQTPKVLARYMLDGTTKNYDSYESAVAAQTSAPLTERFEGTDMLYSSGTTGRPKGVAFVYKPEPLGTPPGLLMLAQFVFGFNDKTTYLSPAPLYHAAPLRFNMAVHRLGGTTVIME
ncbi:MAG: AMP-binding protein, partial [Actinomycetota bacterium]